MYLIQKCAGMAWESTMRNCLGVDNQILDRYCRGAVICKPKSKFIKGEAQGDQKIQQGYSHYFIWFRSPGTSGAIIVSCWWVWAWTFPTTQQLSFLSQIQFFPCSCISYGSSSLWASFAIDFACVLTICLSMCCIWWLLRWPFMFMIMFSEHKKCVVRHPMIQLTTSD
jgi:hypothetical protein